MLGQPRAVDRQPLLGDEDERVTDGDDGRSASRRARWLRSSSTTTDGRGIVAADDAVFVSTRVALTPEPEICWRIVTVLCSRSRGETQDLGRPRRLPVSNSGRRAPSPN